MNTENYDAMRSAFRLTRAMMRRPRNEEHAFSPAEERMLMVLRKNDGKTSAELCEIFDIRPSSMSEKLGKMEAKGLIVREESAEDKRAAKVFLSEFGKAAAEQIESGIESEKAAVSACFTEEELAEFCRLCDKLSDHLNEMSEAVGAPEGCHKRGGRGGMHGGRIHCGGPGDFGPHGRHGHHGRPGDCGPHGRCGDFGPDGHHGGPMGCR